MEMNKSLVKPKYDTNNGINASCQIKMKQETKEKWILLKNILCLGFAFMLHLTVFQVCLVFYIVSTKQEILFSVYLTYIILHLDMHYEILRPYKLFMCKNIHIWRV